jgi:hypothetical protein
MIPIKFSVLRWALIYLSDQSFLLTRYRCEWFFDSLRGIEQR